MDNSQKIVLLIMVVVIVIVSILIHESDKTGDCLKEVAKDYCEDRGMSLHIISSQLLLIPSFSCLKDERSATNKFFFTPEEKKECREK